MIYIPVFGFLLWFLSSLIFPNGLASFFPHLFLFLGVGLVRLFLLVSADLLICLVLLVFIVYMGFLQYGCLELLINEIWVDIRKFYSVNTTQPYFLCVFFITLWYCYRVLSLNYSTMLYPVLSDSDTNKA